MPSLAQMQKSNFLAKVDSGLIRYVGLPTAAVVLVDGAPGAYSQLFIAANAPQVPYWLCGFQAAAFAVAADVSWIICLGYGGVDGGANAPAILVCVEVPVIISAEGGALGSNYVHTHWLPYPVAIPAAQRMAARIDNAPTGADNIDEFRVILATVVGQGN